MKLLTWLQKRKNEGQKKSTSTGCVLLLYAPVYDFLDLGLDLRCHLTARDLLKETLLARAQVVEEALFPCGDLLYRDLVEKTVDTGCGTKKVAL
jgi:hypothetical protein